jgi:hypothetical protein
VPVLLSPQRQVEHGRIAPEDAEKYSNALLLHMFQEDTGRFRSALNEDLPADQQGTDFEIQNALRSLPSTAKKLVDTVNILDAFYT